MRFALLGPFIVEDSSGSRITIAGPRLRVLLATLLLHANVPVPADELAEMVWDAAPPPGAIATLRSYVRRLRRTLGDNAVRIAASGPGYVIRVDQSELDALEFETLCQDTRAALRGGRWADASVTAARALRLWRAAPLLDVASEELRREFVPRLERLRLQLLEDRFDAALRLGQHQELIPQLLDMTTRHPLRERFHSQFMLALAGAGQRAQALGAYQKARRALVDQLGIEPGAELREIHRQILADDVAGPGGAGRSVLPGAVPGTAVTSPLGGYADALAGHVPSRPLTERAGSALPHPAQLPADVMDFTGRGPQEFHLNDALTLDGVTSGPGAAQIVVIAGAGGSGKTTLAVHAAHRVRHLFPDGQLYADLRAASTAAAPGDVLARFLRDLGVDGGKVPAGDEERATLYRTMLVDRRVLILLDNAKDVAQVRPLLPGAAPCTVLITTRNRTMSLVSTRFVELNTMPESEAVELLSRIAGHDRTAAEPDETADILAACGGLPLAIRICGTRLASRPQWRVATMAERLRHTRSRLNELQVGDVEVRGAFRASYDSLYGGRHRIEPGRAFRLLGCWPGQKISLPAAVALIGEPEADVAVALETLVDVSLLASPEPNCYEFHDLLRLFAAELAVAEETEEVRLETETRLLRFYLETATAAAELLSPFRYRIAPEEPQAPSPLLNSVKDALAWYDREQANVISAIRRAAAAGLDDLAWRLPTALFPLFNRRHAYSDCVTAHRIGLQSARVAGSRQAEAWTLQNLGYALARVGDGEAFARLQEALAIRQEAGDRAGEDQTRISLVEAYYRLQGPEVALDHSLSSLQMLRQAGNPALLGMALNNHGNICLDLGRLSEASECLQEAFDIWTAGEFYVSGYLMHNLGRVYLETGRIAEAIASLTQAHGLHVASGDVRGQAVALSYLGRAQHAVGQESQARASMSVAAELFESLGADAWVEALRSALLD